MKKLISRDLGYYFIGIFFLTLGIRIIGMSYLGLAFSDAAIIKLSEIFNISIVFSSVIVGTCVLIVEAIVKKRKFIKISSLITSVVLGFFVDFWFVIIPQYNFKGFLLNLIIFLIGASVLSIGIALYLQPNFPPHPNDLLFVSLSESLNISLFKSKIFIDSTFALVSLILAAKIGIGSIFNTLCLGILINILYKFIRKIYMRHEKNVQV